MLLSGGEGWVGGGHLEPVFPDNLSHMDMYLVYICLFSSAGDNVYSTLPPPPTILTTEKENFDTLTVLGG